MKTFNAILIDSANRAVVPVQVTDDYRSYYAPMKCSMFETAFQLPKRDVCFVDEEGMMNGTNVFFTYDGAHQPFAGNGLIIGGTPNGDARDAQINIEEVKSKVKFYTRNEIAAMYR